MKKAPILLALGAVLAAFIVRTEVPQSVPESSRAEIPIVGDPRTLRVGYERWLEARSARGEFDRIVLSLQASKARSVRFTQAGGAVTLDLGGGRLEIEIEVEGLEGEAGLEGWLVEYSEDSEARPFALGALTAGEGSWSLGADLPREGFGELERVVVARAGEGPAAGGLLFASPGLFERLASRDLRGGKRGAAPRGLLLAAITRAPLPAAPRQAADYADLSRLIARGETLFFEETFGGNGRTCGTCHPAENNTTIDPTWIASLPDDDPLFVAETNPALDASQNGGLLFEDSTLLRRHGLIVVNADGFDDLTARYTMRSVPHVLGLVRTTAGPAGGGAPRDRTGWGGDGAPGMGSLREFATGAVVQHMPRTLGRVDGVDFRLPTPAELNALEAFQLSLGSPVAPDISAITMLDSEAEAGRAIFSNGAGTCFLCHFDAGAIPFAAGFNVSLDTGVEAFTQNHPDGTGRPRPADGGFGLTPNGGSGQRIPNPDGSFGNGRFSTASLVEAADTLPAFHSNITANIESGLSDTIEGAISFYNSDEFDAAPGTGADTPIDLDAAQVAQLGAFLRGLNALENERAARSLGERAIDALLAPPPAPGGVARMAQLASLECDDAFAVLDEVGINPAAVALFAEASALFQSGRSGLPDQRLRDLRAALGRLERARREVVIE